VLGLTKTGHIAKAYRNISEQNLSSYNFVTKSTKLAQIFQNFNLKNAIKPNGKNRSKLGLFNIDIAF